MNLCNPSEILVEIELFIQGIRKFACSMRQGKVFKINVDFSHDIYIEVINPFHATDLFWYPLKTSENLRFSDVFRGYQKRSVAWNKIISISRIYLESKVISNVLVHRISCMCQSFVHFIYSNQYLIKRICWIFVPDLGRLIYFNRQEISF